jgi:hypothetical protein
MRHACIGLFALILLLAWPPNSLADGIALSGATLDWSGMTITETGVLPGLVLILTDSSSDSLMRSLRTPYLSLGWPAVKCPRFTFVDTIVVSTKAISLPAHVHTASTDAYQRTRNSPFLCRLHNVLVTHRISCNDFYGRRDRLEKIGTESVGRRDEQEPPLREVRLPSRRRARGSSPAIRRGRHDP